MRTRHGFLIATLALTGLLTGGIASAQPKAAPPPPPPAGDMDDGGMGRGRLHRELAEVLYPVGLVRRHARDIGLTEEQTKKVRDLVTAASSKVESLRWDVEKEAGLLTELVRKGEPKSKVEPQLAKVLSLENALKTKHLTLLLDVRDVLTPAQRTQLDKLKEDFFDDPSGRGAGKRRGMGGRHGMGHGPRAGF